MVKLTVILKKLFCLHLKKTAKKKKAGSLNNAEFVRFDFATIESATANFSYSNKLIRGNFDEVYKGKLKFGKKIAVKRINRDVHLSPERFMIESRVIARIQHTNLVKHIGFCSQGDEKLLVSEFFPSLSSFLSDPSERVLISWETWYKIILGIANGLQYLHDNRMLHYGLKAFNILLDEEMNPKIADFGMASLFEEIQKTTNTLTVGTYGYTAPEYFKSGKFTAGSDVYSFGVVVLKTVVKDLHHHSAISDAFFMHASKLWGEDRLLELIHPTLSNRCSKTEVIRCIQVGILCVAKDAEHRPTMTVVVPMLTGDVNIPLPLAPSI